MNEGCISISVDTNDCQPIGILGYTTNNTILRSVEEPPLDLCELLDDVIYKKKYQRIEPIPVAAPDYTSHFEFLSCSKQTREFYNVFNIKNSTLQSKLKRTFISFFGPYNYFDFRSKYSN